MPPVLLLLLKKDVADVDTDTGTDDDAEHDEDAEDEEDALSPKFTIGVVRFDIQWLCGWVQDIPKYPLLLPIQFTGDVIPSLLPFELTRLRRDATPKGLALCNPRRLLFVPVGLFNVGDVDDVEVGADASGPEEGVIIDIGRFIELCKFEYPERDNSDISIFSNKFIQCSLRSFYKKKKRGGRTKKKT
ncbi:hypothetical protein RFI_15894 [Reticulomyxa filosa]|uniref:Uncharacterized protein n=1 Tax=Reticulomyxa filosa TaxID=46433 RepID=X6N5M5_RETFI|nr:hypothetical protein RFI_15894 [Reticulomyxa filosa]|eukprot:ETO21311.1 hypothetical protein RFI_15894 [Reticulomyxa filosa]